MYVTACPVLVCNSDGCLPGCTSYDAYPYAGHSVLDRIIHGDTGSLQVGPGRRAAHLLLLPALPRPRLPPLQIPYNLCYVNGTVGTQDCLYYFGVYPICSGGPGVGCSGPDAFRVTFEGETGTERIPDDCFASGRYCQLPISSTPVAVTRRYAAYVGDTISTATVTVDACYGDVMLYGCRGTASPVEKCNPVSMPGEEETRHAAGSVSSQQPYPASARRAGPPSNYDTFSTSAGNPNGTASFTATLSGLFYLGAYMREAMEVEILLTATPPAAPPLAGIGAASGTGQDGVFELLVGSPGALVLTPPPGPAISATYIDATQTSVR